MTSPPNDWEQTRTTEPLVKLWDKKAQKCGPHHTVYSVNGDQYTGEWMDNKKHGKGAQVWKKTGMIYDGDWRCGKREGYGTLSKTDPETKEYVRVYIANGNRFVGTWSVGQKNGHGKFYYLDRGQLYEGFWVDGVAKCGTAFDFGREAAVKPTVYPIPMVCLQDSQAVLMEAQAFFTEDKEKSTETTIPNHMVARQYVP
ncbi:MORN repeat-containing protein 3-like [Sinocyclocheilus rhinocerous]|uniref:MORN repeat-containing protein 3-like n=1 Tax=Sinocyclocheilus rhinocerous TaxID=307959 RepID=UPI0007B9393B|nr:PREDICTED: MORN repeat-containing protein 3-like [Sinocyclocheilus rhinocerous]